MKNYVVENVAGHEFASNQFYVYELVDPRTTTVFYVGKGRDDRAWRHVSLRNARKLATTNPHKHRILNSIVGAGHAVIVRICSTHQTEEEAFIVEQQLISQHGRRCDGSGSLVNITRGGEGNTSDGRPVDQYTMWGEIVASYSNAKEAARLNGYSHYSTICGCCKGKERSYKGFLWAYKGNKPQMLTKVRPVYQWTSKGERVAVHRNCSQAALAVGCNPSTINDCVKGNIRIAAGFVWTYDNRFVPPRPNLKSRRVIHVNTGVSFNTVSAAARNTGHNVGDVSKCCSGKLADIGGDRFVYCDSTDVQCTPGSVL